MPNPIVYVEFATTSPQATATFVKELFGWKIQDSAIPGMEYAMFNIEGGLDGGFPKADEQMYKPGETLAYVGVEDIAATLAHAQKLGGSVLVPETDIPDTGSFAILSDPSGARFAIYKDAPHIQR